MTREAFRQALARHGICTSDVMVEDNIKEGFCLRKIHTHWEIFYRERGVEYNVRGFPSEEDALQALFEEIVGK